MRREAVIRYRKMEVIEVVGHAGEPLNCGAGRLEGTVVDE